MQRSRPFAHHISWPHQSFDLLHESARAILKSLNSREKARMQLSPAFNDKVCPSQERLAMPETLPASNCPISKLSILGRTDRVIASREIYILKRRFCAEW
jgi:hypothetical protein